LKFSSQESQNCKDQKEKYPINSLVVFAFDAMKKERIRFFRSAFLFSLSFCKKKLFWLPSQERKKKEQKRLSIAQQTFPLFPKS